MRGDEHDRRRRRAQAQLGGELGAVAAGHLDVEQHQVAACASPARPAPAPRWRPRRRRARCGSPQSATRLRRRSRASSSSSTTSTRSGAVAWLDGSASSSALIAAPRSGRGTRRRPARVSNCAATSCIRRSRSRTFFSAMPLPGPRRLPCGTLLAIESTARPSLTLVRTRITPPSGDGSTPWRTAFSTSGCSSSGGTRARAGLRVELPAHVQAAAEADLLDVEVALRQLDLLGQRDRLGAARRWRRETARPGLRARPRPRAGSSAHQRERGVERVEQEVRPDARLQLGQARRGLGRQRRLGAQAQPLEDRRRHRRAGAAPGRSRAARRGRRPRRRAATARPARRAAGGDRAEADRDEPLQRPAARAPSSALERADDEQPEQHRRAARRSRRRR